MASRFGNCLRRLHMSRRFYTPKVEANSLRNIDVSTWRTLPIAEAVDSGYDVTLPGYRLDDFDALGPNIWSNILQYCEGFRIASYFPHVMDLGRDTPVLSDEMYKTVLPFIISTNCEILPAFYDRRHYDSPLVSKERVVNTGRSSYQHYHEVYSTATRKLLHRNILVHVIVDPKTRRPVQMPQDLRKRFGEFPIQLQTRVTEKVAPIQMPASRMQEIPSVTSRAWHSDVDLNNHINHGALPRYCMDAISEVARQGKLQTDDENCWVDQVKGIYLGEVTAGDLIEIYCWRDDKTINAIIKNDEGDDVFHCSIHLCQKETEQSRQ